MRLLVVSPGHALMLALVACSTERVPSVHAGSTATSPSRARSSSEAPALPGPEAGRVEESAEAGRAVEADDTCSEFEGVRVVAEAGGPKRHYSLAGYAAQMVRLAPAEGSSNAHCVLVAWPRGNENTAGQPVNVAARVRPSWFRVLENTLARIPWQHARLVRRLVIDNRPTEHGIAPFDRQANDDARDGHTIWLHEHVFTAPNHWARGNHGSYWSYHVSEDGRTVHDAAENHDLFSPVLVHEIGHLVMYHLVNRPARGIEATAAPSCAHTCGETQTCSTLQPREREKNCISPYCMPFRFPASTENWAEQYRFYFQSSRTRQILKDANAGCLELLLEHDDGSAPWLSGKPDVPDFRRSLWQSCGGRACKGW